jgi:indolepyruvate ferredoxin oxidoreductase
LSGEAVIEAIRLNGVAVDANHQAFHWGRLLAFDEAKVAALVERNAKPLPGEKLSQTLDDAIERRLRFLAAYQDEAYAERYRLRVEAIRRLEARVAPGEEALSWAVVKNYFKLLAFKDEYEVARLYTDGSFRRQLERTFEGDYRLEFHLAPPLLSKTDPATGRPRKVRFGPWIMPVFRMLAGLKVLRGTRFDIFGYSTERKQERQLIHDYEALLEEITRRLSPERSETAIALASLPEKIRGFGPVKLASIVAAREREADLLEKLRGAPPVHKGKRKQAA